MLGRVTLKACALSVCKNHFFVRRKDSSSFYIISYSFLDLADSRVAQKWHLAWQRIIRPSSPGSSLCAHLDALRITLNSCRNTSSVLFTQGA